MEPVDVTHAAHGGNTVSLPYRGAWAHSVSQSVSVTQPLPRGVGSLARAHLRAHLRLISARSRRDLGVISPSPTVRIVGEILAIVPVEIERGGELEPFINLRH